MPLDGLYHNNPSYYPPADASGLRGRGIVVYVLDTGLRWSHKEFASPGGGASRASLAVDLVGDGLAPYGDCDGHGESFEGMTASFAEFSPERLQRAHFSEQRSMPFGLHLKPFVTCVMAALLGTHVAATVGGITVGVARDVTLKVTQPIT